MGQVLELAKRLGKKVALAGRSMEQNVRLGIEAGYFQGVEGLLIPSDHIELYKRNEVIVMSTGSQGEHRAALVRVAHGEHPAIRLQEGDLVLMSSKFIPGNEKAIGRMINSLFKQGAEVLYEAVHDIHVSGHATRPELKTMLELTKPRYFIPIHGEYRHLIHHAKLAREVGIAEENILIATDGDVIELTSDSFQKVARIEEPRVLVEGREGNDVSRLVLRERRQIGEKGIVFALMVRNAESRRIISGPEVISKGLTHESMEGWLIEEAKNLAKKIILEYDSQLNAGTYTMDLQETIRIELRRFFNSNINKKPVVLPIILDL
jgi:ribonuclease J